MPDAAAANTYQERKEQGVCTRPGCRRRASDESSLCVRCHRAKKRLDREHVKRKREARRAAGLCVWCPGDKPSAATEGSTSCLACRVRRNRIRAADGGVGAGVGQDRAAAIAAATRKDPDGRTRYHGQQRRGQQTHAQLHAQDLRMLKEHYEPFCEGLGFVIDGKDKEMHREQRDRLKIAIASKGERIVGHIDDILERLGHFQQRHGKRDGE